MESGRLDGVGIGGQRGSDDIQFAEHCRGEEIEPRTALQQELCDVSAAHVGGGSQHGFKIAATPIPGGVDEGRLLGKQFLDTVKIAVRVADKFLYECSF